MDAQRQGLRGEDNLDQAALEEVFDEFLEVWEETRMVHRQSPPQRVPIEEIAVELSFIGVFDLVQAILNRRVDLGFLGITGQVEAVYRAARQRLTASAPREDEVDRRQEFSAPKTIDHGKQVIFRRSSQLGQPEIGRRLRLRPLARLARDAALVVEQGIKLVAHR